MVVFIPSKWIFNLGSHLLESVGQEGCKETESSAPPANRLVAHDGDRRLPCVRARACVTDREKKKIKKKKIVGRQGTVQEKKKEKEIKLTPKTNVTNSIK